MLPLFDQIVGIDLVAAAVVDVNVVVVVSCCVLGVAAVVAVCIAINVVVAAAVNYCYCCLLRCVLAFSNPVNFVAAELADGVFLLMLALRLPLLLSMTLRFCC